jgi:uncharacterized protein YegP (UPF0339 family)
MNNDDYERIRNNEEMTRSKTKSINGQNLGQSEGYISKSVALKGIH